MPATILPFPSRRTTDIGVKVVGVDRAAGKRTYLRHVCGTWPPATTFPVRPNLTDGAYAGSRGFECQVLTFPPATERVLDLGLSHNDVSKPIAYRLTSGCPEMHGSSVSADIVHFVPMDQAPNRIRELRNAAGISQETLGERMGVHKMTVSDLERGKIELTLNYMRRVATALNVAPADVLLTKDDPARPSDIERELLDAFRASPEAARDFLLASAKAVAQPQPGFKAA